MITSTHSLGELLQVGVPDEPDGYVEFWTSLYERARAVDVSPSAIPLGRDGGFDLFEVRLTSLGDVDIGAWLAVPTTEPVIGGLVVGHGYGGREAPELRHVPSGFAAIFPVARGQPTLSLLPGVPPIGAEHVLVGIDSVDTYIHGGCVADTWCAATALLELVPGIPAGLSYFGGSFGGGIGAMAMPWDARFSRAALRVPSFGNHDVRLTIPCTGSGESVRNYVAKRPETRQVLAYFDSAVAACHIDIPTLVAPALRDPAVPPPGQFAVYNALNGPKELYAHSAGHLEYPAQDDEDAAFKAVLEKFLRQ